MPDTIGSAQARSFRASRNLTGPIYSLRSVLNSEPEIVLVERPTTQEMDGAYALDRELQRGFIFINSRRPWTRRRFTMAHELGHHVLGHQAGLDRNVDESPDPAEASANAFAAEFLMPAELVHAAPRIYDHEEAAELAAHFMVSGKAMLIRLVSLGRIERDRFEALNRSYDARIYRDALASDSPDKDAEATTRFPKAYVDRVRDLYRSGEITAEAACEALDHDIADAEEILPPRA